MLVAQSIMYSSPILQLVIVPPCYIKSSFKDSSLKDIAHRKTTMASAPPFPSPTKRWHTKAQPSTSPSRPELSARGKSVVITGGGTTGIGGETARHFAQAGASRIALLGRREGPLLENKAYIEREYPEVEVLTFPTDVTKPADVDAAFSQFASGSGSGKIDVLVHTAANIGPKEPVSDADGNAFLESIHANFTGAMWVAKAFVRHAAPEGAVAINVSSWFAHLSISDGFAAYSVSKMAAFRLWDTVALANRHLSVFHTQPGVVLTEMNLRDGAGKSFEGGVQVDDGEWGQMTMVEPQ